MRLNKTIELVVSQVLSEDLNKCCEVISVVQRHIVGNCGKVKLVFSKKDIWNFLCCVAPAKRECVMEDKH